MAQTEMKLRLIKDNKIFRIVDVRESIASNFGLYCDSFELGINENEWFFEGDVFKVTFKRKRKYGKFFIGTLKYLSTLGCWVISEGIRVDEYEVKFDERFDSKFSIEKMGNIHDNGDLLDKG